MLKRKKKEKKEEKKGLESGILEATEIFDSFREDEVSHEDWNRRAQPEKAYEYFETNQTPEVKEGQSSYWVQVNRIREAQKTRMGILTNSPPVWEVSGRGKDASDRDRIKLIRYLMVWMGKESLLFDELLEVLRNYSLVGMGWLRLRFDKAFITQMETIGMTVPDSLDPRLCYPDGRARKAHVLDGRRCTYIHRVTKDEFAQEWGDRLMPDGTKIRVDKIFRDIEDSHHPDYALNVARDGTKKEITVLEVDYWRGLKKQTVVGDEELTVPMKEYRVALAAGYEVLADYVSPVNDLKMWQKVLFSNDPMHDLPYSSSDFQAEKELQDLSNVMLSMTLDNMARQMNSPLMFHKGTIDESYWKGNAGKASALLGWEYTPEMLAAGIPPAAAMPQRLQPGQVGADWLQTMQSVENRFDKISINPTLKGENQPGVTSGKHAQLLAQQGMQPSYYTKQKLAGPLRRVGQIYYHHAKMHMTDEMELPVDDQGIGVDKGIIINRILSPFEKQEFATKIVMHGPEAVLQSEETKMLSIRRGDDRLSITGFLEEAGSIESLMEDNVKIVDNDITFGNFNVALTIDPMAEASKLVRVERAEGIAQLIISIGAVKTGLKYLLETAEEPEGDKLLEEVEKEMKENVANQPTDDTSNANLPSVA